jgi:hypothetical protein
MVPPRRFKIEPIETSVISSKDRTVEDEATKPKPARRFAPEPMETTTKTNRKFAPQPMETTARTNRKFAPEPVETSQRTNRKPSPLSNDVLQEEDQSSSEEVEITISSPISPLSPSRQKFAEEWGQQPSPRRPRPQPLATTSSSNRRSRPMLKRPPGRFSPQLIETAQRSRKANDNAPALFPADKTDATPEVIGRRKARILGISPSAPVNSPSLDVIQNPLFLEIQQGHASCPLARRRSYFSSSEHSFRVPDLDTIDSSESEASTPPSPTTSSYATPDHSFMYKEVTRRRESVRVGC